MIAFWGQFGSLWDKFGDTPGNFGISLGSLLCYFEACGGLTGPSLADVTYMSICICYYFSNNIFDSMF